MNKVNRLLIIFFIAVSNVCLAQKHLLKRHQIIPKTNEMVLLDGVFSFQIKQNL
jgi:hypothetical protein